MFQKESLCWVPAWNERRPPSEQQPPPDHLALSPNSFQTQASSSCAAWEAGGGSVAEILVCAQFVPRFRFKHDHGVYLQTEPTEGYNLRIPPL